MSKKYQQKDRSKWVEGKPNLDAARERRGICFIPKNDPDYEEILNTGRRLENRRVCDACNVTAPVIPNGSSWERPCASDWSKIQMKRLNSSCSKARQLHIADRGQASMSHCPIPLAMAILEAKAAVDKEWTKLHKIPAWVESKGDTKSNMRKHNSSFCNFDGYVSSQELFKKV